jgi:hypothetical protein
MKHKRHSGIASDATLREVARIRALISDLERRVGLLDCDIAALAERRKNLDETIAALEKAEEERARMSDVQLRLQERSSGKLG